MSQSQLAGDLRAGTRNYNTPLEWVAPIADILGGFDLDPCASDDSRLAETNIRNEGGLRVDWSEYEKVWCNHPYATGEPEKWLREAYKANCRTVVTLSKADPSTEWFQRYYTRADLVCFPSKRIQFIGHDTGANFPNVFGVFGEYPAALREHFESVGWTIIPGGDA